MASGIVLRYSDLSRKNPFEVETLWRRIKKESSTSGYRNKWNHLVPKLRESLQLKDTDCNTVYVDSLYEAEVISETPNYIFVSLVEEKNNLDSHVRKLVESNDGILILTYDRISNERYGNLIEMTDSCAVGGGSECGTNRTLKLFPDLSVKYGNKLGKVKRPGKKKSIIKIDDDEIEIDNTQLKVDKSSYDSYLKNFWKKMDESLSDEEKLSLFKDVLKENFDLSNIPDSLINRILFKDSLENRIDRFLRE